MLLSETETKNQTESLKTCPDAFNRDSDCRVSATTLLSDISIIALFFFGKDSITVALTTSPGLRNWLTLGNSPGNPSAENNFSRFSENDSRIILAPVQKNIN